MQEESVLFQPSTIRITSLQVPEWKDVRDSMRFGMMNFLESVKILEIIIGNPDITEAYATANVSSFIIFTLRTFTA